MSKKKENKPTSFVYESFTWTINWFEKTGPNVDAFGTTDTDRKIINIYSDNLPSCVAKEVLHHELEHVIMENVMDMFNNEKSISHNEELQVRVISPRRFMLMRENPHLFEYLYRY